jgi:hypothetical protein
MFRRIVLMGVGLGSLVASPGLLAAPAVSVSSSVVATAAPDFRGAVEIFNCSGALVRWADSRPDDAAMMLTNGHCRQVLSKGSPTAQKVTHQVIVNRPDSREVTLIGRNGNDRGVVKTKRLLYSTSFKTDVGLYLLRRTYAEISHEFHLDALTISATAPDGDDAVVVPSGFSRKVYTCTLNGTAFKLFNDEFLWRDSLRFTRSPTCHTIHGTSGSPLLDPQTRDVVGINNAINFDSGQPGCELSLCEETPGGVISVHTHRRYAQQTWWLTTCVGPNRRINLDTEGCLLPKPVAN